MNELSIEILLIVITCNLMLVNLIVYVNNRTINDIIKTNAEWFAQIIMKVKELEEKQKK